MRKFSRLWWAAGLAAALSTVAVAASQGQSTSPAVPPVPPHTYDLDSTYIRMPLAAADQAYGRLDGARIKQFVNEITGVSRKSRDDGERYWGRIAGTKYDDMIEGWTEQKRRKMKGSGQ